MRGWRTVLAALLLTCVSGGRSWAQSGPVNTKALVETQTLSAWNSGTALNATQTIFSSGDAGFDAVIVYLTQTTTLTAGAVTFEYSYDNATWLTVPSDAVLDPTSTSYAQISLPYTVQASTNKAFLIVGKGWIGMRAKLSTQITGTGAVTPSAIFVPYQTADTVVALSPTAANLNATVVGTGTFVDQATLQTQTDTVMVGGVNVKEINGVAPLMGAGATGTGAQRVNDVASSATGAAPPASGQFIVGLGSGATGGLLIGVTVCDKDFDIDINTATTTLAITGVAGRQVRICSFNMVATATDTVAWIEGTGATCGTGTAGMIGTSTAAHGQAFAANGGIAIGNGIGEVLTTATTGDSVCLVTSAATQLDGHIKYAIY